MPVNQKGQVTIFLCIVLLAVTALAGVLADGARMIAAGTEVPRAVSAAARSALAAYSTRLKDEYGIFALDGSIKPLDQDIEEYIGKNLMTAEIKEAAGGSSFADLYDYRLESLKVEPVFSLNDSRNIKAQILEYMKYRAPVKIIEGIWDKLSLLKQAGSMSEVYSRKMDVDKTAGRLSKAQQKLKLMIDGTVGDGKQEQYYVSKFDENGIREEAVRRFGLLAEEYKGLLEVSSQVGNEQEADNYEKRAAGMEKELSAAWKRLYNEYTQVYLSLNEEAAKQVEEVLKNVDETVRALEKFEEDTGGILNEPGTVPEDFMESCADAIRNLKASILDGRNASALKEGTLNNIQAIRDALDSLSEVKELVDDKNFGQLANGRLEEMLNDVLKHYDNKLSYDYMKPYVPSAAPDPRKGLLGKVSQAVQGLAGADIDMRAAGIDINSLPSSTNPASGEKTEDKAEYAGELLEVGKESGFKDEEEGLSSRAFNYISSMNGILGKDLADLRDNIYLDEYIIGTFRSSVEVADKKGALEEIKDFRGIPSRLRDTFFQSEIEYILHGSSSQEVNKAKTKAQILLVRFGLNTLHVFTDGEKRELAYGIAAAAAGWWTGGAGIPVAANLIMCGWGMAEAVVDLQNLMDGKLVPFYKQKGDWMLNMGISSIPGQKSDDRLCFSYRDYLRLFLLVSGEEQKLGRLGDLLELNMRRSNPSFKLKGCSTYLRVEAEVSIKYLFMTRPFVPAAKKTQDGRYKIKVVLYEGY